MPRVTETIPVSRHTLWLFKGDYARLRELSPRLGAAIIIRRLVRAYIVKIESTPVEDVELKEIDI